ncbi:DMT family transporter [Amycolatopsis sp. H20-H5]|uniref:DMT family transporter n=1 Tax=Amycolatopsis sp. H20-H5 TaxID=3046309 RepID=UPI002DB5C89A|nr:DMT family transporter [Amycolatopsis sp. H20-H5]MEC3979288.1 DMT family transporter [Amycolatopsis sp. H20-H5]
MKLDDSATTLRRVAPATGILLSALGVLVFSFSFPATAWSLHGFGAWTTSGGRCVLAALLAAVALKACRVPLPRRTQWRGIAVVSAGCVLGFPILTTLALRTSSTAHSAVVIGMLPLATAVVSSVLTGRRPSRRFWLAAGAGAVAVLTFTVLQSQGAPSGADLLLFGALVLCAFGYAEGGRLAAEMPGWQVIAWALVVGLPVTVPLTAVALATEPIHLSGQAVAGFAYVALLSQSGGFVAWYKGMAQIGVARASQLQLAQPLLTLVWAVLLLHEQLPVAAPITAVVVLGCIAVTQRART